MTNDNPVFDYSRFKKGWLLSIDPGFDCGLAAFFNGELRKTGMAIQINNKGLNRKVHKNIVASSYDLPSDFLEIQFDHYACEMPEDWRDKSKGSSNDLFHVAAMGFLLYACAGFPISCAFPSPKDWKGGTDKKIQNKRDFNRLSSFERNVFQKSRYHNDHVLDSIGVGLWALLRGNK